MLVETMALTERVPLQMGAFREKWLEANYRIASTSYGRRNGEAILRSSHP
ncbi:hypothetical protein [Chthonomonas calidirosea]|nr:hypothetical protein [Chthonomonas calidirosea]